MDFFFDNPTFVFHNAVIYWLLKALFLHLMLEMRDLELLFPGLHCFSNHSCFAEGSIIWVHGELTTYLWSLMMSFLYSNNSTDAFVWLHDDPCDDRFIMVNHGTFKREFSAALFYTQEWNFSKRWMLLCQCWCIRVSRIRIAFQFVDAFYPHLAWYAQPER